jgi:hypothetical protein
VRWWLEEDIRPWLSEQPPSVYPDITVQLITGWGKHREAGQTGDIKQAVAQALVAMGVPLKPEGRNPGLLAIDCAARMQQNRPAMREVPGPQGGTTQTRLEGRRVGEGGASIIPAWMEWRGKSCVSLLSPPAGGAGVRAHNGRI